MFGGFASGGWAHSLVVIDSRFWWGIMSDVAMPGDEPNDSGVDGEQDMDAAQPYSAGSVLDESSETNERKFDLSRTQDIADLIGTKDDRKIKRCIEEHIRQLISESGVGDLYNVLFLFDNKNSITRFHSERIYDAVKNFQEKKDILLFLRSKGGKLNPPI